MEGTLMPLPQGDGFKYWTPTHTVNLWSLLSWRDNGLRVLGVVRMIFVRLEPQKFIEPRLRA